MRPLLSLAALALALALTLLPADALAAPADFNGTWVLDLSASDSPEEFMKAQGVSLLVRKAAASMVVTQAYTASDAAVTIAVSSSAKDETQQLTVDNTPRTVEGENGPATARHYWADDGALVSEIALTMASGDAGNITTRRSISGATMTQVITLVTGDETVTMKRVFTKQ